MGVRERMNSTGANYWQKFAMTGDPMAYMQYKGDASAKRRAKKNEKIERRDDIH